MRHRLPFVAIRRRPFGRHALACLLVLGLVGQGLGQAIERIGAPTHSHRQSPAQVEALRMAAGAADAATRPAIRDDHRSIPWIGGEPPASDAGLPHGHAGVAAHRHELDDDSVVYVDTGDDASGTAAKPVAAACALPASVPRVACEPASGHAAWRAAQGWHVLALTEEPLDRPPR